MADFKTLKQRLGRRRGFDGNDDRLGDFINDAYLSLCGRRPTWSWLRRTLQFGTVAPEVLTAASATPGAAFTKGSRTVANMTTIADTRTGAKIKAPDGTVNRFRSHDGSTNGYMEAVFGGTTSPPLAPSATPPTYRDSWTLYFDEYPLPSEASSIESVVATGNGWTIPIPQQSMLSPDMKARAVGSFEAYPRYYSVERHNTIPAPPRAPTLTAVASSASSLEPNSYYWYRYCWYNTRTLEIGPLSPAAVVQTTSSDKRIDVVCERRADYGLVLYRSRASTNGTLEPELFHQTNYTTFAQTDFNDTDSDASLGYSQSDEIASWADRPVITSGGSHVRFWPPPDDEYVVDITYFVVPRELSLDSDTPSVPRQYHNVILDLAEALALSEEENHSAAATKRGIAMEMMDRMEREDDVDPATAIELGRGRMDPLSQVLGNGSWPRHLTG